MRPLSRRFVAPVLAAAGLGLVATAAAAAPVRPPVHPAARGHTVPVRVAVFGDSLAHEAKGVAALALAARTPTRPHLSTYPATALCDFRVSIAAELLAHRPDVLILEFSGNSFTPCMLGDGGRLLAIGSAPWRDRYLDDLRAVLAVARTTGTRVVWATAPPLSPDRFETNYPRGLAAAIRDLARDQEHLRVVDTGAALTTDGRDFAATLPCRPDEQAYCRGGRVEVRSDDGIHFDCHGVNDGNTCAGYSAGGRRFGEAIAAAALAAGQPQPPVAPLTIPNGPVGQR
jgi:hypothetical protein